MGMIGLETIDRKGVEQPYHIPEGKPPAKQGAFNKRRWE